MPTHTNKLNLLLMQEDWKFGDESFNKFIKDADDKLVGVAHLASKGHWSTWQKDTVYNVGDVVRISNTKSHQYYQCTTSGVSGTSEPANNVTNSVVSDGTVKWIVKSLTDESSASAVKVWLSGDTYVRGDVVLYGTALYRCKTPHTATTWATNNTYWTEIFSSIRAWRPSIYYFVNDTVLYNNMVWQCAEAHTSNTSFNDAEKYKWLCITPKGIEDWVSGNSYDVGQFVVYNGALYECTTANSDTTFDPTNWQKIAGGGLDTWTANTSYGVGDIVINANKIYQCNTAHTSSSTFTPDANNWTEISACITRIPNWEADTEYVVGDLVAHDAKIYRCVTAHTSDPIEWNDTEEANWEELSPTINEISMWAVSTNYAVGQLVIHNNKLYRCNTAHTSDSTSFNTDIAYWDEIGSSGGIEPWKSNELYTHGNMVVYNDKIYVCDTSHTSTSTFDSTKWHEISSNNIDSWQTSTSYSVGDMVVKDGQLYRCITAHTSDNSDFYTDISKWDILDTRWLVNDWTTNTYYFAGEIVLYDNTIYKCTTSHTSLGTFELDKDDWSILNANTREWVSGVSYKVGDIVIYGDNTYKCSIANNDGSFFFSKWSRIDRCNLEVWKPAPDQNTLALLHFDIPGNLERNEYETPFSRSKSPLSTTGKFGSSMNLSPNKRGIISSPSYEFTDGTEVYTIEFWFYVGGSSAREAVSISIDGFGSIYRAVYSANDAYLFYNTSYEFVPTNAPAYNAWNHYAFVISASECNIYINGKFERSLTRLDSNPVSISFGDDNSGFASAKDFRIDELRVSNVARYSQEFTPPTEPFEDPNWYGYKKDDLVVYEDKIYMALVDNNDIQFDKSKWVEVSPCVGIEEWTSGSDYNSGDVILYNNNLYKVVNDVTGAVNTPDNSNDYVLLGGDSIKTWAGSKEYSAGTIVLYQNRLYRNANDIPSSVITFNRDDWTSLSPVLEDWTSSKEYKVGDFVIRNDILYECITDNNDATFNSAKWKPISKEGINAWQSNKQYALYDLVVEDEELYMCISPHTSSSDFQTDLAADKWKLIGGGGGSGGDWKQVTKMNVIAPLDVDINIPYTNIFKRPPVEVLKYEQGTTDITTNVLNFGVGDGSKFEVDGVTAKDSPLITFDGVAKPNHDILYSFGTPTQMVNKYYSESEEIDLDDFKVVGEVSLE